MAYRPTLALPPLLRRLGPLTAFPNKCALTPTPTCFSFPQRLSARSASQWGPRGPRRPDPRYNRFGRPGKLYSLWYTSPGFRYGLGAVGIGGGAFYIANLDRVPITGRRRFNCVSPATEKWISDGQFQAVLQQYRGRILPPHHSYSRMVNRVMSRLIPLSRLEGEKWEVRVIDDPDQKNAFVMPG
ncbi:MAG: hypothetical protein Q9163_000725 [Psora crenata]